MANIKIKAIGKYNGHDVKANKSVNISFKLGYDQLVNTIKLTQLLNENITIITRIGKESPIKLGMFMLRDIKIDHDGESMIKLNSQMDYVEADNLNKLLEETLQIMFVAEIEIEEGEENNEG